MGSGDWLKSIISLKKVKSLKAKKGSVTAEKSQDSCKGDDYCQRDPAKPANGTSVRSRRTLGMPAEDVAATRIQTAFRAYRARKTFRHLRGMGRLQALTEVQSVKKQAATTLSYLHSWSRIQSEVRARRNCMVTEGKLRQKKLENQLKLEAKLHDLEVEWSGGPEALEEVLARIHQREEAAVKRERAMAYAFSHQWRANSNAILGYSSNDIGKANWGWSWKDRWITARPWESRQSVQSSPKKALNRQASKNSNTPTKKKVVPLKPASPTVKGANRARKLSYEAAEKPAAQKAESNTEVPDPKRELVVS